VDELDGIIIIESEGRKVTYMPDGYVERIKSDVKKGTRLHMWAQIKRSTQKSGLSKSSSPVISGYPAPMPMRHGKNSKDRTPSNTERERIVTAFGGKDVLARADINLDFKEKVIISPYLPSAVKVIGDKLYILIRRHYNAARRSN